MEELKLDKSGAASANKAEHQVQVVMPPSSNGQAPTAGEGDARQATTTTEESDEKGAYLEKGGYLNKVMAPGISLKKGDPWRILKCPGFSFRRIS
jgi:hypothetical protein